MAPAPALFLFICSMNAKLTESRLIGLLALGLAALFISTPEIDLAVAHWFSQNDWHRLFAAHSLWVDVPYHATPILGKILLLGLLACWLRGQFSQRGFLRHYRRLSAFFLAAALLGPLLIVDSAFKSQLGRARPAQTEVFGGPLRFTPAFLPSDQCQRNCSFVSGHVATTAFIMAAGWLGSTRTRRRWLAISVLAAGYMGVVRMSTGSHFLSDCVFAWFSVYFGLWLTEQAFRLRGWLARSRCNYRQVIARWQWQQGRRLAWP